VRTEIENPFEMSAGKADGLMLLEALTILTFLI